MTPKKRDILIRGQTGIAQKVYECVPMQEPWASFQVLAALRNMTGSTPDTRIVSGCLASLVDAGLIKKVGRDQYQRIVVARLDAREKTTTKEPQMAEAVQSVEPKQTELKRAVSPLEMLGELATEIVGMAEHMKRLAARVEDVALAVEQEREVTAKSVEQYRQLKALLKSLQGEVDQ
ncbi:MAG: hypothetical protein AB1459_04640 [Pseudomonadota bacterium]